MTEGIPPDENSIESIKPYFRGSRQVERMKDGLPLMVLHDSIYIPLVRPAPNLIKEERDKPIAIKKKALNKKGKEIEQSITISYSNDENMGAPSHRWYDIQMALFEELQKGGYNTRELRLSSINRMCKRIGAHPYTVINDLEKSVGITVRAVNWFYDMKSGLHRNYAGRLFAHFDRIKNENGRNCGAIFEFDEYYFNYIQNNLIYSNRTYDAFFDLDSTVAKVLMSRLIRIFHSKLSLSRKPYIWKRDIKQLGRETALTTKNIRNLKVDFSEAGRQLKDIGLIKNQEIVKESKTKSGYVVEFLYNWQPDPWKSDRIGYAKEPEISTSSSLDIEANERNGLI